MQTNASEPPAWEEGGKGPGARWPTHYYADPSINGICRAATLHQAKSAGVRCLWETGRGPKQRALCAEL